MKFSLPLLSSVLCASSVVAAPRGSKEGLARRIDRREAFTRLTHPLIPLGSADVNSVKNFATNNDVSHVEYSSNWAGAVYEAPPSGQTFNKVTAQITVPSPTAPSNAAGTYAASAWVGIDGDTYGNAILQTGVDFYAIRSSSGSTRVEFDAWYEWFPDYAYDFSGFTVSAGDKIQMTVTATSLSAGTAVLENLTTGQTVSKSLTAPSSSSHLGGQNAEWIVEDFESGNSLVPFANFGTVLFTGASASTSSSTEGTSGATIIEIQNSSRQTITDVTIPSNSEVQVQYV
ncbi:MAG: hypothetical protein Q9227_007259 [Pyrenula ochraceoflavens]